MSPRNALKALTTILAATCLSGCFQVLVNGPVGGATVQIETLTRNGIPSQVLQVTTTRDEAALIEEFGQERWDEMSQRLKLLYLGTAEFDYDALDDDTYYLIAASGGVDYDYDHDWVIDEEPTPINGTWTMVATGAQLRSNRMKLTPLSHVALVNRDILHTNIADSADGSGSLNIGSHHAAAARLVKDIDGNGIVQHDDLQMWVRAAHQRYYRYDAGALNYLSNLIRDDEYAAAATYENRDLLISRVYKSVPVSTVQFADPALQECMSENWRYDYEVVSEGVCLRGVDDLGGIEQLTGLRFVRLETTNAASLEPLQALEHLEYLWVEEGSVDTSLLDQITGMEKLNYLVIEGHDLGSADWLNQLPPLVSFTLEGSQTDALSVLDALSQQETLVALGMQSGAFSEELLPALESFPEITRLYLDFNGFSSLEAMPPLSNLKELHISYNPQLNSFASLPELPNLEALWARGNQLTTTMGVSAFPKLNNLQLFGNQLGSLEDIPELSQLETLNLEGNLLTADDIGILAEMPQLEFIGLAYNRELSCEAIDELQDALAPVSITRTSCQEP